MTLGTLILGILATAYIVRALLAWYKFFRPEFDDSYDERPSEFDIGFTMWNMFIIIAIIIFWLLGLIIDNWCTSIF